MPRLLALTALISLLSLAATPAQGDKKKEKKEKASTVYTPVPDPCPQMRLDKPLKNSPIAHTTQRGPVNTVIQGLDVSHYQGTIDWQERSSARAKMRMLIKKLLKKHRYPPEGMEDAVQTVMTQCELWTDNQEMGLRYENVGGQDVPMAAESRATYGKDK